MTAARTKQRKNTKQAKLAEMLQRPEGATLAEMITATGWKPNSVRSAVSGALKTRMGIEVTSEKDAARGLVYRAATGKTER